MKLVASCNTHVRSYLFSFLKSLGPYPGPAIAGGGAWVTRGVALSFLSSSGCCETLQALKPSFMGSAWNLLRGKVAAGVMKNLVIEMLWKFSSQGEDLCAGGRVGWEVRSWSSPRNASVTHLGFCLLVFVFFLLRNPTESWACQRQRVNPCGGDV